MKTLQTNLARYLKTRNKIVIRKNSRFLTLVISCMRNKNKFHGVYEIVRGNGDNRNDYIMKFQNVIIL